MKHSLLLQGGTVVGSDCMTRDDVLMRDGIVEEIDTYVEEFDAVEDVSGMLLLPALIDCHVHFREPGGEHKGTMETEAAAAYAGGVTTVCEMPNTNPPTVTVAALADKIRRASAIKNVDMRFFFGITEAMHLATLRELCESTAEESMRLRSRLAGVKIYLDHSTGNQKVANELVGDIFKTCSEHSITMVAHCEDPAMNTAAAAQNTRTNVAVHSLARPAESEKKSIEYAIDMARTYGTHLHIAHLSTEGGIELVAKAKEEGLKVTCEVTPHHLFLTTDDYEKLGTLAKMNPPVRSFKHVVALWQGIADGTVDCISTDHAPHTLEEKNQAAASLHAPSGVPGVETMLPLLLTVAAGKWPHPGQPLTPSPTFTYKDIVRLCVVNPSKIFKLQKNEIEEDKKVEILVVDPQEQWAITADKLHYKCGWTPFEGWNVTGALKRIVS